MATAAPQLLDYFQRRELCWTSLFGLYFSFHSEFHSAMLNGVSKNTGKNMSFNSQKSWVGYQDALSVSMYRNQQRTDLSLAVVDNLMSEVSIMMIQLKHGQKFLKAAFNPSGLPE